MSGPLTPDERERFDAIVEHEQQRDPFFRAGRAVGMVLVPLVGLAAVVLVAVAACAAVLACAGVFTWGG